MIIYDVVCDEGDSETSVEDGCCSGTGGVVVVFWTPSRRQRGQEFRPVVSHYKRISQELRDVYKL